MTASSPSDVPVREPGTRARSGNAMGRTRSALLQATADCVARYGVRKTTMVDVASRSGVAKATLYNHFRTKGDVLAALVEQRVSALAGACAATAGAEGIVAALVQLADALHSTPALRKTAADEPGLLAPLTRPDDSRGWQLARDGAASVLSAARLPAGPDEVALVLRWAVSQLAWPLPPEAASGSAATLARALGAADPAVPAARAAARPAEVPAQDSQVSGSGLGWPT